MSLGCGGSPVSPTPTPPTLPPPVAVPDPGLLLTCPPAVTSTTIVPAGAPVTYTAPTASGGTAPVTVTCAPLSGSTFPIGTTPVACTAADAASRTASCGFPVSLTLVPTLTKTTFLAFGDSITTGEVTAPGAGAHGLPRFIVVPAASYPTQLRTLLAGRYTSQTFAMTNAGQNGEWAADGALRFPGVITSVRPEVVLLLEGYNDPLATTRGMSEAAAAMDAMAKEARFRGARVFLAGLTPSRPGPSAIPSAVITAYNNRLRIVASGEGAVFVNLYDALLSDVNTYIGSDGLHPTEAGYRRMAETFFAAIRADLEVK